ncbi:MAG: FAD:protein FMN transferase [Actinomycetota bacterium]|nr:FAD:protein FMN transferase [Actinomycetota bacterium]
MPVEASDGSERATRRDATSGRRPTSGQQCILSLLRPPQQRSRWRSRQETAAAVWPSGRQPSGRQQVDLDRRARTVRIPRGVILDLGAAAKALAADRAADRIAETTGTGVLVGVGADVAVAGPASDGGWAVGIAPTSSSPLHALEQVIAIEGGGLASSSPAARSWVHRGAMAHHIIGPATGAPAARRWRLVSAAGSSCIEANAATTAAVAWGADALDRLVALGTPARLVAGEEPAPPGVSRRAVP